MDDQLPVGQLDLIDKGIHKAAAVGVGALGRGDTELLKQEDDLVTAQRKRLQCGERGKLVIEGAFLLLQIGQPGGQGGAGGAVFDGAQDVADFAADLSKRLLQGCTLRIGAGRLGLLQAHDGVCKLLDVFRPEQQIGSGLHYELFQHILRHIFPGTGAAKAAARAGIVMIDAARGVVAADALHQAAAFAAVQLAGEDIVCLGRVGSTALTVEFDHFLCPFPQVVVDDGRDSALDADVKFFADVYAAIPLVADDAADAALIKRIAPDGAKAHAIEPSYDGGDAEAACVQLKDKAHRIRTRRIYDVVLGAVYRQTQRGSPAQSLAFEG